MDTAPGHAAVVADGGIPEGECPGDRGGHGGGGGTGHHRAGLRLVTLQLWFLPMYMVLIALTLAMHAAHRRWGLAVPAAMGAAAAMVSAGVTVLHLAAIGYANYLLVWGSTHQWGFAWRDGILTRPR